MKDFVTSAKRAAEDEDDVSRFKLDDFELTAYRPSETQMVMLLAAQGSDMKDEGETLAAFIDFSMAIFNEDSKRHLTKRLMTRTDPFDHEVLLDIIMGLVEEFAERPTKPSSDSTSLSGGGGDSLPVTASATESTSSPSPQLVPAT